MALGAGVYCIGSPVEYNWCAASCLRELHLSASRPNCQLLVSTDYDMSDKLFFKELTFETVIWPSTSWSDQKASYWAWAVRRPNKDLYISIIIIVIDLDNLYLDTSLFNYIIKSKIYWLLKWPNKCILIP